MQKRTIVICLALFLALLVRDSALFADDVFNTKHNLSASGPADRQVTSGITQVCVFCHTPHGGLSDTPLWNRNLSLGTYTPYSSPSMDAVVGQPTGYSKLCLSCHDGTFALGDVLNAPNSGRGGIITMIGAAEENETMRYGSTNTTNEQYTGDTRRLGTDLSNDHPVSFSLDQNLIGTDEELVSPYVEDKGVWLAADVRLYPNGFSGTFPQDFTYVQCTSCHNPHDNTKTKFLRANKYNSSVGANDQICSACHSKTGWIESTHEQSIITYKETNTDGSHDEVGKRACLACHDTHTEHGAVRLTREGGSNPPGPSSSAALENTCFQCHTNLTDSLLQDPYAPDIKTEFDKLDENGDLSVNGGRNAMPLQTNWSNNYAPNGSNGTHAPVFISSNTPGRENALFDPDDDLKYQLPGPWNVHVECVDCHNPHQVKDPAGPITPGDPTIGTNGGRLEGMKGVKLDGSEVGFHTSDSSRDPYVYEICLRCHGETFDKVMRLPFDGTINYLRPYTNTNKRIEFDASAFDPAYGPPQSFNSAFHPVVSPGRNRSAALCDQLKPAFDHDSTWDCAANHTAILANLTIQCTDCHNSEKTGWLSLSSGGVNGPITQSNLRITDVPTTYIGASPVGPHGSSNPTPAIVSNGFNGFTNDNGDRSILRGYYFTGPFSTINGPFLSPLTAYYPGEEEIQNRFELCFNCHDWRTFYGHNSNTNFFASGVYADINLHSLHVSSNMGRELYYVWWSVAEACMMCHYNIHSNIQATNTQYTATSVCLGKNCTCSDVPTGQLTLPPDNNTHLINFMPEVITNYCANNDKPAWFYNQTDNKMQCNIRCHGAHMNWQYNCNHTFNDSGGTDTCQDM